MNARYGNRFGKLVRLKDERWRQKLYVFLICLAISVFIWFLIMLSDESVTALHYPVKFTNLPAGMVLINKPDSVLNFRISSGGFELFTFRYLNRKRPIEIDLKNLAIDKSDGYFTARYPTSQLSDMIFKRFNFSEELVSISPEFIIFRFEKLESKYVPVRPKINIEFEKPFRQADSMVIIPDSAMIAGQKENLNQISWVNAVHPTLKNINSDVNIKSQLEIPEFIKDVDIIPGTVNIYIPVEKFTESSIQVPVKPYSDTIRIKTFPPVVSITYLVSLNDYERISESMFEVIVDSNAILANSVITKLIINKSPSFVKITRIEPGEVEYLVIK